MSGSGLQTKTARSTDDIVSGQVAPTQLPQTCECLPPMHHTPVIYKDHLEMTRGVGVVVVEFGPKCDDCFRLLTLPGVSFTHNSFSGLRSSVVRSRCAAYHR